MPAARLWRPSCRAGAAGDDGAAADLRRAGDVVAGACLLDLHPAGVDRARSGRDLDRCADPLDLPARPPGGAMNFASDNAAGIAPEILAAIARTNDGPALAYGQDAWTRRVEQKFAELFEREVAVFLVPTGTAANA